MQPRYHHRARWTSLTEDAREAIRARARAGEPYSVIARELNFCRVALRKLCPRPPVPVLHPNYKWLSQWTALPDKTREATRTKIAAGARYTDLARETGISPRALANVCPRSVGKPSQKLNDRWAKVDMATVVNRVLAGASYHSIARECGIPYSTFYARVSPMVEQSRPSSDDKTRIVTPRDIAERIRAKEQVRRVDEILKRAGLTPTSRMPKSAPIPVSPAPHVIAPARHFAAPRKPVDLAPTAARALPRGDQPVMDAARWGTGEADG